MWDKMETFYHVVRAGSFTKAEQVLNKTQSTLSRSVILLEERLGCRLLDRGVKGLVLTRKGEEVFRAAQSMFMSMNNVKAVLNEKQGMNGKIRICTSHALASYMLIDPLIDFKKQYPDITIELIADDSLIDLIQKEVDIGIRPYSANSPHMIQKYLCTLERGLYASKEYLAKYGEPKTLVDLDKHRFITRSRPLESPYADVEWVLKLGREGKEPRKSELTGSSDESLLKATSKGLGITSSHKEFDAVDRYKLVRILPEIATEKVREYLVYPKSIQVLERIQVLENFLLCYFAKISK